MLERDATLKVLLIDDHALIREALRGVFADLRTQAAVLEAASRAQALEVANASPDLDLILLDLALPDADGLDLLADFRSRRPTTSVVVLSASRDPTVVARALRLGALGFVPKSAPYQVMIAALQVSSLAGSMSRQRSLPLSRVLSATRSQPVAETGHADPLRELPLTDRQPTSWHCWFRAKATSGSAANSNSRSLRSRIMSRRS